MPLINCLIDYINVTTLLYIILEFENMFTVDSLSLLKLQEYQFIEI